MTAVTVPPLEAEERHTDWRIVVARAPQLAVTAWRYLDQVALSMRPASVHVADNTLRTFARYLVMFDPGVRGFADVEREHIEDFKSWFARTPTVTGKPPARNTIRQRHGMLRIFFERIIEWGWEDAPERTPIFAVDVPVAIEPLPRFLDDAQAAKLLAAAARSDLLAHLVIELLARTGMRVGELCDLQADAVVHMDGAWWLRVPVGKLHNDRYVPLHPNCVELLRTWTAMHPPAVGGTLITVRGGPLGRHQVSRIVRRVASEAGLGHVHPHQLRHTLATQAINRGMRLEAIAAMLGTAACT
jgi:integrase